MILGQETIKITNDDQLYFELFDRLQELGFNTQAKLEQVIDIIAEHRGNLPKATEKILNMLED